MKKIVNFLVIAIFSFGNVFGQEVEKVARFETELNDGLEEVHVFKHNSGNLMVLRKSEYSTHGEESYIFSKYNSRLTAENSVEFQISKKYFLFAKNENGNLLHTIFIKSFSDPTFILYTYDILTNKLTKLECELPDNFKFMRASMIANSNSQTQILGNKILIHGKINKVATILLFDLKTGKYESTTIEREGVKSKKIFIASFIQLPGTNEFACLVVQRKSIFSTSFEEFVYIYNDKLELQNSVDIKEVSQYSLLTMTGAKVGTNKYIFSGSYTAKMIPQGIYIMNVNGSKIEKFKFVGYGTMPNFYEHYNSRFAAKMAKKREKLESKGKELVILNFITIHPLIIINENEFVILGELYTPMYHTETTGSGNNTRTVKVFDGNQYTHAICIKFNKNGDILWDKVLDLSPSIWPLFQKEFITAKVKDNTISFFQPLNKKVGITTLDFNGKTVSETIFTMPKIENGMDEVKMDFNTIEYWYDNFFIQVGTQRLKQENSGLFGKRRSVYYMNKWSY